MAIQSFVMVSRPSHKIMRKMSKDIRSDRFNLLAATYFLRHEISLTCKSSEIHFISLGASKSFFVSHFRTNGAWKSTIKLQFIENQIKICEEIKSPRELEYWYSMLGAHLSQYGTEKRVRVLLDDLLGSIFQRNRSTESILVSPKVPCKNSSFLIEFSF